MKKILTLIMITSVLLACTKQESPVTELQLVDEKGEVSFSFTAPDFVLRNTAGLHNANKVNVPDAFQRISDMHAMLFSNDNGRLTYLSPDIKDSLSWSGNGAAWVKNGLVVPVGLQKTLVVFNATAMYDQKNDVVSVNSGTLLDNIRFHLAPKTAYTNGVIANDENMAKIYETAANETITAAVDIPSFRTEADRRNFPATIKRINSKVLVNMAYDQSVMFPGMDTAVARFRVTGVTLSGIPESVDYTGARPAGSVTIMKNNYTNTNGKGILNAGKASSVAIDAGQNVFTTLAFPSTEAKVDINVSYTTDGGRNWTNVTLSPISIDGAKLIRNQMVNVNVWLKNRNGQVDYTFTFKDWTSVDQGVDGEEAVNVQ